MPLNNLCCTNAVNRLGMSLAADEGSPFVVATYYFFFATVFTLAAARPWTIVNDLFDKDILLWGFLFGLIPATIA